MKILHLCAKDYFGAGRAAYRLHNGLCNSNVNSTLWVGAKQSSDSTVVDIHSRKLDKLLTKIFSRIEKIIIKQKANGSKEMYSIGTIGHSIRKKIKKEKPDIVHLHWVNRGFININELKNIDIPIVISLHDMWWFSAGCHYDEECDCYSEKSQHNCSVLVNNRKNGLAYKHIMQKKEIIDSVDNLTFVGLSKWMAQSVSKSIVAEKAKIVNLPNGIDTKQFEPRNMQECRSKLSLSQNKKLILFAAVDALSESRKGYKYISKALMQLNSEEFEFVVIGEKNSQSMVNGFKTHFVGAINNDNILIDYLSAVDVSVIPSLQENLSNMIMENLSCGTPVVAFNVGGNADMIEHKKNGYLAELKNVDDLANGIIFCSSIQNNSNLATFARQSVLEKFEISAVAQKYKQLYASILKEK